MSLALASALLFILSFPSFNQPWCAWVGLVPWLLLLRRVTSARAAFGWSWLIGFLFSLGSGWWLIHVTVVGWILICAYSAIFFGAFGLFASYCFRHQTSDIRHQKNQKRCLAQIWCPVSGVRCLIVVPAGWAALEYLRSHLLSGWGWNLLGYSQTPWVRLIQFADLTGVWGVSFVVVLINVAFVRIITRREQLQVRPAIIVAAVFAALLAYGEARLSLLKQSPSIRVAVVQGNIPQEQKWDEAFQQMIVSRYETLTEQTAQTTPDLIIWPETSVPGYLGGDEDITQRVLQLAKRVQRPLLVGAPVVMKDAHGLTLRNSAVLINAKGEFADRYDKVHLVPFGEFIPGERALPWLRNVLPPIGDFVPGQRYTVFTAPVPRSGFRVPGSNSGLGTRDSELKFSALICFEDIFPALARRFVNEGARMLVVITNDAWFGPTAAAYQHAQASTFRAVELRVPVVRAANTGWSGCIDAAGRWIGSVHDAQGRELFVAGTHTCDVLPGAADSLYRRFCDWFALVCLLLTVSAIIKIYGQRRSS